MLLGDYKWMSSNQILHNLFQQLLSKLRIISRVLDNLLDNQTVVQQRILRIFIKKSLKK